MMQKRFRVKHGDVFPTGAFLKGAVEPVADFNAGKREDGSRPLLVPRLLIRVQHHRLPQQQTRVPIHLLRRR